MVSQTAVFRAAVEERNREWAMCVGPGSFAQRRVSFQSDDRGRRVIPDTEEIVSCFPRRFTALPAASLPDLR